jgi:transposase
MREYIGVDWGNATHAVWVEDEAGAKVASRTVPHTAEGFADWGRWLEERRAAGRELWAAIERPDGRVVDFLLDHGVVVYPVNPKALDRARDRFRMSGAKSDGFDARVAASFLRTDHPHLHPLRPSSAAAQELKGLTRDYTRQVRQQTRLLNQLTITLTEYYPRALEVCEDLKSRWGQAFLRAYPTPQALGALTARRWPRWAHDHRLSAERATALWATIERPHLAVPAHVVRVKARRLGVLLEQFAVTSGAVETYRQAVADFFAQLPAAHWAASLPGGRSGTTIPTLVGELGDAPGRWESAAQLQGQAGTVPVTERSGQGHPFIKFRFACNTHLRAAVHQLAFQSLRHSEWARAQYDRCRQRGHSHHHALRVVGAKWLKIIFALWTRGIPYDEQYHLASMARHQLRQPA